MFRKLESQFGYSTEISEQSLKLEQYDQLTLKLDALNH